MLGLAALGLGALQVLSVDTDSLAVRATTDNAVLNDLPIGALKVTNGSVEALAKLLEEQPADLLLCNILAPVIEALAPHFSSVLHAGGRGLLSGLLVEQAPRLTDVLGSLGWTVEPLAEQGRWGLLEIRR